MKILRILNRFNLGGPTYNVAYLTKYLTNEYETLLIGGNCEDYEENSEYIIKNLGITPIIIPEMKRKIGYNDYLAYKKIKKIIQDFKPDIVHTHASKAGFLGRYAAHKCNVPVIVHTFHGHVFHSYFGKTKTFIFKIIERKLATYTDKIIAISDTQKYELTNIHRIAKEEKFQVVALGFDLEKFINNKEIKRKKFRTLYMVDDDTIVISIIGRLAAIKNHQLFINAIADVKNKTTKQIRAFIVGDGELKNKLQEQAKSKNLSYSNIETVDYNVDIVFTSWIKDADFVFAGSDIAVLTSLNEGTPVSLIEAQAADVPIVATRIGGIEDIVIENKTALLCENNNLTDFSEKLLQLIENDEQRNEMKQYGKNFVKNKFSYERLVKDMQTLYKTLLSKKKIKKNKKKFFLLKKR